MAWRWNMKVIPHKKAAMDRARLALKVLLSDTEAPFSSG